MTSSAQKKTVLAISFAEKQGSAPFCCTLCSYTEVSKRWFCKLCNGSCVVFLVNKRKWSNIAHSTIPVHQPGCMSMCPCPKWFVEKSLPMYFFTECMRIEARGRGLKQEVEAYLSHFPPVSFHVSMQEVSLNV